MNKGNISVGGALAVVLVGMVVVLGVGWVVMRQTGGGQGVVEQPKVEFESGGGEVSKETEVRWWFDGTDWRAEGDPPECPEPLLFPAPVDVSKVSGILYPGQIRGTDYKPHGGFRFDNRDDNEIEVRAIMDGYVLKAAKYDDGNAEQTSIFFVNDCGLMVVHDHILTPSAKLAEVLKDVKVGHDSRTTEIRPRVNFKKGEVLAMAVGYENFPGGYQGRNVFVDFGLYDLRRSNGVEYDVEFRSKHANVNEYGRHAVCWLDYLNEENARVVRGLPAGGREGKVSDYCK